MEPPDLLRSTLEHPYEADVCFACAHPLDERNRTEEHVIPRWLQERHGLMNQRLPLLNSTPIPYKQLKVPCCKTCNNETLSDLEAQIRNATLSGFEATSELPDFILFRWLAKIFLGIQYKELFLQADRRAPESPNILPADFVRQYAILHFWLQMATKAGGSQFCPGSIWVLPVQESEDSESNFDLVDDAFNGVIMIRTGGVILIADFLENGVHRQIVEEQFPNLSNTLLHPQQARELAAIIVYQAKLLEQVSNVRFLNVMAKLAMRYRGTPRLRERAF